MSSQTALAEYQQTSAFLPPTTICTYLATLPPLVDLRLLGSGIWDPIWQHWNMDWRRSLLADHLDPPTWDMADMAIEAGFPGIIFPSVTDDDGTNLVLFMEPFQGTGTIDVLDPGGTLPKNDASWQ